MPSYGTKQVVRDTQWEQHSLSVVCQPNLLTIALVVAQGKKHGHLKIIKPLSYERYESTLPPAMGKIVGQNVLFNLQW